MPSSARASVPTLVNFDPQDGGVVTPPVAGGVTTYDLLTPTRWRATATSSMRRSPSCSPAGQTAMAMWRSADDGKTWAQTTGAAITLGVADIIPEWSVASGRRGPNTVYVVLTASGSGTGWVGDTNPQRAPVHDLDRQRGDLQRRGLVRVRRRGRRLLARRRLARGGSVVVMTSDNYWGDFWFWSDTHNGAGLVRSPSPSRARWATASLCSPAMGGRTATAPATAGRPCAPSRPSRTMASSRTARNDVPKLFTDGNGAGMCLVYTETTDIAPADGGDTWWEPVAQCSSDLGAVELRPPPPAPQPSPSAPGFAYPSATTAKAVGGGQDEFALSWSGTSWTSRKTAERPQELHVATVARTPRRPTRARRDHPHDARQDADVSRQRRAGSPSRRPTMRFDANGVWMTYWVASQLILGQGRGGQELR